jgi:hypothetical protein
MYHAAHTKGNGAYVGKNKMMSYSLEQSLIKPAISSMNLDPDFYSTARIQWCGNYHNFTLCIAGPTDHTIEKTVFSKPHLIDNRGILFAYVDRKTNKIQSMAAITFELFWHLLKQDSNLTYKRTSPIDGATFRAITFENVDGFVKNNPYWSNCFLRLV